MDLNILYEDESLIVLIKPPKVPTQPDKTGDESLVYYLEEYLKKSCKNPYVGIVHRLDRPVGGIMVFAKNKLANEKLSEEIRNNNFKKNYVAVVCGKTKENEMELKDYLIKNQRLNSSKVVPKGTKDAKEAILKFKILETVEDGEFGELSLVKVELFTGRHHQIRVQLANIGLPLWGDNKYNDKFQRQRKWTQIALWSESLSFYHPVLKEQINFQSKSNEYPFNKFNQF